MMYTWLTVISKMAQLTVTLMCERCMSLL